MSIGTENRKQCTTQKGPANACGWQHKRSVPIIAILLSMKSFTDVPSNIDANIGVDRMNCLTSVNHDKRETVFRAELATCRSRLNRQTFTMTACVQLEVHKKYMYNGDVKVTKLIQTCLESPGRQSMGQPKKETKGIVLVDKLTTLK